MDLEQKAVLRLREGVTMSRQLYDGMPLMITYSGGKDSDVIAELAVRHLTHDDFEIVNNHTTADAPETVYYIRRRFAEWESKGVKCRTVHPTYKGKRTSMWDLIPQKLMPPTRTVRYCCAVLKETTGKGRMIATGVRWEESIKRRNRGIYETITPSQKDKVILMNDNDDRKLLESCIKQNKRVVNPIIDWHDYDVWDYLSEIRCTANPLYQCGFSRVGCIGCPMAGGKKQIHQFYMYPKFRQMYVHAFDRMIEARKARCKERRWETGEEVMEWWTNPKYIPGQLKLVDVMEDDEV